MVDDLLSTRIRYATRTALESYTKDFEKKAQEERKLYIDVVEKSVKDIIKDEVKSLLSHILPKEVSDFATPVIQSTITESLKNVVLAKSSSQPQSTYEVTASLTEFKLKKILIGKLEKSKSYRAAKEHRNLYDALIKSYQLNKDLFDSYGSKSQPKSSGKSAHEEEPVFETADTEMPQDQGDDMGNTKDQPNVETAPTMVKQIAQAEKPPLTFDELLSTPINFSAYVMHNLKIDNLTQEILNNPKGHEYPFNLSKSLSLIEAQCRQVVPADYFFNNDLEYLKGRSSSRKYTTSTIKTKAARYDNIEGIEDIVLELWSPWYGYGYFEEIIVRREDQSLHKFKEGDFPRLNLRDIEDLLLLLVQKKLSNLEQDVIFDLNAALRMFTRLMRSDELYKFYDGTLTYVRRVLHDIANNLRMDYLPKRRWSNLDRKRSRITIKVIDQQLFERRLMRNLEKFVGGREYRNDFRLLERMI
ncbi:hypothetical protein Tco_0955293 [Tanacetum coccineum]|uniref:Uncharacterized protein n=1 Tax=Tanacetum coccineum TaxID=301880 RepID=A0ABQ5E6T7_9ASTR